MRGGWTSEGINPKDLVPSILWWAFGDKDGRMDVGGDPEISILDKYGDKVGKVKRGETGAGKSQ